jgi:oxygen-independent coproporphyrinogen-3 oxidase
MLINLLQDKKEFFQKIKFTPFLMQYPSPDLWKGGFSKLDFLDHILSLSIKELNLYFHIPFCDYLCTYCSFSKILKDEKYIDSFLTKLEQELDFWTKLVDFKTIDIKSIFI